MILDVVIAAARKRLRDLRPLVLVDLMLCHKRFLLRQSPGREEAFGNRDRMEGTRPSSLAGRHPARSEGHGRRYANRPQANLTAKNLTLIRTPTLTPTLIRTPTRRKLQPCQEPRTTRADPRMPRQSYAGPCVGLVLAPSKSGKQQAVTRSVSTGGGGCLRYTLFGGP